MRFIIIFRHLLALALLVVLSNFAQVFQALVQASSTEVQRADITMGSSKHLQLLQSHSGCIVDTLQGSCYTAVRKCTTAANNQLKQDLEDEIEFATKEMNQR